MELIPSHRAGRTLGLPLADHSINPWHKIIDASFASRSQLGKSLVADDRPLSVQTDMDKRWRRRSVARCVRTPTGSRSGRVPDLTSITKADQDPSQTSISRIQVILLGFPESALSGVYGKPRKVQFLEKSRRVLPEGSGGGPRGSGPGSTGWNPVQMADDAVTAG